MNKEFIKKAKELTPKLYKNTIELKSGKELCLNEKLTLDFKDHYVGYITFNLSTVGRHFDAPVLLKLKMAEKKWELNEDNTKYNGWIAKSWIQEEIIHIDTFPTKFRIDRRYALRYLQIEVLSISTIFKLKVDSVELEEVTSANQKINEISLNEKEKKIDRVAIKTLRDCMQLVFEDGPKRDRRLWLGDLRLQALVNYVTYKNNDLVKRCIYLFAAVANKGELLTQSIFIDPEVQGDEKSLIDYSLLYACVLDDYYKYTKDIDTVKETISVAIDQFKTIKKYMKNNLIVDQKQLGWCFIDWSLSLEKECACNGVYLYALKKLINLKKMLGLDTTEDLKDLTSTKKACLIKYYDTQKGLFVCNGQISYASNIWMILAEVSDDYSLLNNLNNTKEIVQIVTPYLYHYYIEALLLLNKEEEAVDVINNYWGKMIGDGADTFYELFNPDSPNESPYGSRSVNSYCHAWSTTPAYFYRILKRN